MPCPRRNAGERCGAGMLVSCDVTFANFNDNLYL